MNWGFILRLDNKKLLRIWQKLNLLLHWHLASFFFLACLKNNDKDTITETRASKFWMDDEICTIFYHLHFQKWKGMTIMLRKGCLRTRRHFQCSLSFHPSLSSDCYFGQNKIFSNFLTNKDIFFRFYHSSFLFSGNAALCGKCILSYHLLPLLANCTGPPAPQFVISRR